MQGSAGEAPPGWGRGRARWLALAADAPGVSLASRPQELHSPRAARPLSTTERHALQQKRSPLLGACRGDQDCCASPEPRSPRGCQDQNRSTPGGGQKRGPSPPAASPASQGGWAQKHPGPACATLRAREWAPASGRRRRTATHQPPLVHLCREGEGGIRLIGLLWQLPGRDHRKTATLPKACVGHRPAVCTGHRIWARIFGCSTGDLRQTPLPS